MPAFAFLALRLLLGGLVANMILAVTLVLAAAVAGLMAYHYAQARIRERRGYTFDPNENTVSEEPEGAAAVRAKSAEEISHIRSRIEVLMEEQNLRSETQSQHLAQRLDDIRQHMGSQDLKLDGLKSELRHEIRRRDGELDELRGQLASALDSFWKAMPALPEGAAPAQRALPPAAEDVPAPAPAFAPAWQSAAPAAPTAPEPTAPAPVAPPAFAPAFSSLADVTLPTPTEAVSEPTATPEPEAAPSSSPSWADASTWAAVTASAAPAEAAPSAPAEPVFAAPTPEPTFVAPTPEPEPAPPAPAVPATPPPAFASMDAYFAPADAAPAAPPDADDLTVIRGIDAEIQQKLYAAGVYHLDEMARWSRADARRISGAVGIPEETITHEWIFEAQSVLFDSYQQQMVPAARAVPA